MGMSAFKGGIMKRISIGTRGSPLALAQAHEVRDLLATTHKLDIDDFEIRVIVSEGDRILDRPLSEVGGKGLFTKEIEHKLLNGGIDMAVHSMKDMETALPDGLTIGAVLAREDVRDAFISLKYDSLQAMPEGSVVGTSSLRRQAQVKRMRPDLQVIDFRGNVQTRLGKLADGVADATFLANAGLRRLGYADKITSLMSVDEMLPAVAQGAVGVEIRADDAGTKELVAPINDAETEKRVSAERTFLARLDGSCRTPLAGLAIIDGDDFSFAGMILSTDGAECHKAIRSGKVSQADMLATDAAEELLARAGENFWS
jgi:hydroxymethylbilane synthase